MKRLASSFVLAYIKFFAKLALSIHKPYTIGVAGSVGKSSTRNAIYSILREYFKTYEVKGNSETGIPLGILGFKTKNYRKADWAKMLLLSPFRIFNLVGYKYMVVEMGIDDPFPPKNMEYLLTIIKPDTAINLNVSSTHTMQFEVLLKDKPENIEEHDFLLKKIAEEDTRIIRDSGCKIGIYNADDKFVSEKLNEKPNTKLKTFGDGKDNSIFYSGYDVNLTGTSFGFKGRGDIDLNFDNMILPQAYREVFAAAILATEDIVGECDKIMRALEKNYVLPAGRSSVFEGVNNTVIIDSSYNASKNSVLEFVSLLKNLSKKTKRPSVFLFGDMRELGNQGESVHKEVMQNLYGIDYLYLVGPLTKQFIFENIDKPKFREVKWFENSEEAGAYLSNSLQEGSIFLAKGSQNTIFLEEAVKRILKNSGDIKKLCRQDKSWLKLKRSKLKVKSCLS